MKERWDQLVAKIDAMSLRERALVFAAVAFALVAIIDSFFMNPLLQQQKRLSSQVVQQQEKMKEIQGQLAALLQAKQANKDAPQRERISQLREQIAQGDAFLRETQDKLVPPERMAHLLEQVLAKNGRLQLVSLETLQVSNFIEEAVKNPQPQTEVGKQIYKHGVKIAVRGSYADLTQYLQMLEKLPTQMFWGMAKLNVVKYPEAELTLTLYTLSLDKTWLQV
ncbi:MAG: type II secretion system protein M [Gammaproteobacteria bacterium]|nr:type II secretion system protein M [Gammaproteobacteria bacterium]MBU1624777.1 type II secretion system protein M [Gammaproteobacteria bacterium]MBU1982621.1 type II secretion system protein M [Gammaproteobacteria bacterium]